MADHHSGPVGPKHNSGLSDRVLIHTLPSKRVLFQSVSSPLERWGPTTHHKPEGTEPICPEAALQDSGHPQFEGPTEARGLAGQSGPERCLLHNSHTSPSQEISQIHVPTKSIPVYMSPLRAVFRAVGLHQNPETCSSTALTEGCEINSIYG